MSIAQFWPTDQNCLDCIKPEAENPADWVFLAVHQTMTFHRGRLLEERSDTREVKTEEQLLKEFLRDDPSGRVILPVLGESGIGKSHVIRWLDVKLRQRKDAKHRHIIRIPKSSSLKSVLGLILKDLKGERYDDIRRQMQSAREQMDSIEAKQKIRSELSIAIEKRAKQAAQNLARAKETGTLKDPHDERWHRHGDNRYLPAILHDPATSRLFMEGTPSRPGIFAELARHLTQDTSEADAPRRQFEGADFIVPKELENEISTQAGPLATRYLGLLRRENGRHRQEATELLNEIVDDAIKRLATPADTSLSELFYDVRRQLLADGRELVLLVEDFAVLAGIQTALFDAMIREAEVSGRAEACVMRTALAVTRGYFDQYKTVLSRAVHGWYIDEVPEDEEEVTVDRMCEFFGAYLNAARIGTAGLKQHFHSGNDQDKSAPNFSDTIALDDDDDARQQLESFGHSKAGHALFPLNRLEVRELAGWKLRNSDSRLKFNPRSLLNDVLLPILRENRTDFEAGEFPPRDFLGFKLTSVEPDLRREVSDIVPDDQVLPRLLTLLYFWGGNPRNLANVELQKPVYETFKLPALDGAPTGPPPTKKLDEPKPVVAPDLPPQTEQTTEPPEILDRLQQFDAWRKGSTLPQQQANALRSTIREHLLVWVDWDAAFLKQLSSDDVDQKNIYLPNAKGGVNNPEDAVVVVATDSEFQDADVASRIDEAMRGLIRYEHYKTWDYPKSERDYAAYTNFFSSRVEAATDWLRANYKRMRGDPVPAITESLLWSGRLLNVQSSHAAEDASLVEAVFAEAGPADYGEEESWDKLRSECHEYRGPLREELLMRIGARQGRGDAVHAIDVIPVLPIIKSMKKKWELSHEFPDPYDADTARKQLRSHVKQVARHGGSRVQAWRTSIKKQSRVIIAAIGDDFDKAQVAAHLREATAMAKQFAIRGDVTTGQIESLLDKFQAAPIVECLQHIRKLEDSNEDGVLLSSLAQLDTATLELVKQFVENASAFIKHTRAEAQARITNWSDDVVLSERQAVDALLGEMQIITGKSFGGES